MHKEKYDTHDEMDRPGHLERDSHGHVTGYHGSHWHTVSKERWASSDHDHNHHSGSHKSSTPKGHWENQTSYTNEPYTVHHTYTRPPKWYDSGNRIIIKNNNGTKTTMCLYCPISSTSSGCVGVKIGNNTCYIITSDYSGSRSNLRDMPSYFNANYYGEGTYTVAETRYRQVAHTNRVWVKD